MRPLEGKVAVVAGATRGAGRAIAAELGACGAIVYCTGRSVRGRPSDLARPETIEETAERVTALGGQGIAMRVDHTVEEEVAGLFRRIKEEQRGRLDILINDIYGGDLFESWGKPFWEASLNDGLQMQRRAVHSHMITSHYGAPLLVEGGQGLIVEPVL
jgi:NAD(P)-dependent dehydrogenase (short-subunit alcohol dehydrogenase family)